MALYKVVKGDLKTLPRQDYVDHCLKLGKPGDLPIERRGVAGSLALTAPYFRAGQRTGYQGYLKAPQDAVYTLHLMANPGMALAIDGQVLHNKRRMGLGRIWTERIALEQGMHEIQILDSDNRIKAQAPAIYVRWQTPDMKKPQQIPGECLFH